MIDDPLNRTKVLRGSQLPQAKLHEDDVQLILQLVAHRDDLKRQLCLMTNERIAEKFNVHRRTIDRITAGEAWGHVKQIG